MSEDLGDSGWVSAFLSRAAEIMREAKTEFALAALFVVMAGLVALIGPIGIAAILAVFGGVLGYFGHRTAVLQMRHDLAMKRLDRVLTPELPAIAEEIRASARVSSHWNARPGVRPRSGGAPPPGVTPFEYLLYRHTRSADHPPADGVLPAIRHFVDLRQAALDSADLELMTDLICSHLQTAFPDHSIYTGVLIPHAGNVALGLSVARRLAIEPVLVRNEPMFGRSTETLLSSGVLMLVDDVWSSGAVLRRAVELARFDNFSVAEGLLLIARTEGDPVGDLASSRMEVSAAFQLGDLDLDEILSRVRTAIAGGPQTAADPADSE